MSGYRGRQEAVYGPRDLHSEFPPCSQVGQVLIRAKLITLQRARLDCRQVVEEVARRRNGYDVGLAIKRSRVQLLF